jgi:KipI family sensor histidine kinase inhibitor
VSVSIERLGESALVVTLAGTASIEVQRRVWRLAHEASGWEGVADAVCGDGNLTLITDPEASFGRLEERLRAACDAPRATDFEPGRLVEVQVDYSGDCGPDLALVAAHAGLSEREAIECHAGAEYVVYFLGFLPGFAYLGGLDSRLHVPRRRDPRTAVAAGSVAIGGALTGIYPFRTPGGWHVIGRTRAALFEPQRAPAALLAPGDRVRFVRTNG